MSYFQMLFKTFKVKAVSNVIKSYFGNILVSLKGRTGYGLQNNIFVDSSSVPLVVNRVGNVGQGNFSPFNPEGWCTYLPAAGNNLSITNPVACSLGTSNFTIETWINLDTFRARAELNGQNITQSIILYHAPCLLIIDYTGKLKFTFNAIANDALFSNRTMSTNVWTHIAITREGDIFSMYIDGVKENSFIRTNITINSTGSNLFVGNDNLSAYSYYAQYNGFISNLRITKNEVVYPQNFTVSTVPLVKTANTALLLFQNNYQVDNGNNEYTIVTVGSPSVQIKSPFKSAVKYSQDLHSQSVYFDGASSLNVPAVALTGQFQFETWVYPNDLDYTLFSSLANTANEWSIAVTPINSSFGGLYFYYGNYGSNQCIKYTGILPPLKQWSHIAIVRDSSNVVNFYLNGKKLTTFVFNQNITWSDTRAFSNAIALSIGTGYSALTGYLSNTRLLVGSATYTDSFTPPTVPLTAIVNTKFLLKYNSAAITNIVGKTNVTTIGNASLSTAVKKFNIKNCMYFDGSGDWLNFPNDEQFIFSSPSVYFTIEAWINPSISATHLGIVGARANAAASGWCMYVRADSTFYIASINSGGGWSDFQLNASKINTNTWTHVALVKTNLGYTGYVNGVPGVTLTSITGLNYQADQPITIGALASQGEFPFNGYIEDFRITREAIYDGSFIPSVITAPTKTQLDDPYFNKVNLLLKSNSVNNGNNNVFIDSSINNLTLTKYGNPIQGSFSPFNPDGWSGYFNGTSDNITANIVNGIGSGDFTVEYWVKHSKFVNWITHFCSTRGGTGFSCGTQVTAQIVWYSSGAEKVRGKTTMDVNTWYHIAYTRTNGVIKGYLNGVQDGTTGTDTTNFSDASFFMGCLNGGAERFQGNISNLRVVKGTAVYTADFIVPTVKLENVTNTILLAFQDNSFKDNSINALTLPLLGAPKITNISPFDRLTPYDPIVHGGSTYFDGVSYLSTPAVPALTLATSDFTIEAWAYLTDNTTYQFLLGSDNNSSGSLMIAFNTFGAGTINFGRAGIAWPFAFNGGLIPKNAWHHIAITRNGASNKCFVNGKQYGATVIDSTNWILSANSFYIGVQAGGAAFKGYLSDFRIIKGTALYDNDFNTPTESLKTITNTQLLLSGTNSKITDVSSKINVQTMGTVKTSTAVSKFNNASMQFDGSAGCFIKLAPDQIIFGAQDFTIEFHYYKLTQGTDSARLFQSADGDVYTGVNITDVAGILTVYLSDNGSSWPYTATAGTIPLNVWNHIVIRRTNGVVNILVNGVIKTSFNAAASLYHSSTHTPVIGGQTSPTRTINGYIEDFRITLGKGRYTCEPTQEL